MSPLLYIIFEMCFCCLGPEVIPPTQKGKTFKFVLTILMIPHLIVVILNFVAWQQFALEAIFGLFFLFILYVIQHQCNYQCIMIFIFISIFFAVTYLVFFMTPVQNSTNLNTLTPKAQYNYAVSIISFAYYTFLAVFGFYPYREFKGIAFDQNPALRNYFQGEGGEAVGEDKKDGDDPNVRKVDYDANYGNIDYDKKKRNNDHGTFEVFRGQGVKIG